MMRDFILFATLDRVHMEITYCFCVYGERNGYYKLNLDITCMRSAHYASGIRNLKTGV